MAVESLDPIDDSRVSHHEATLNGNLFRTQVLMTFMTDMLNALRLPADQPQI